MIRYALLCNLDHAFESWFDSSAAYEKLHRSNLVECPHCGSTKTRKALMSPQLAGTRSNKKTKSTDRAEPNSDPLEKLQRQAVHLARKIRKHVKENAENVGDKFAREVRKIHHQNARPRNIYGQATKQELFDLVKDDIEITPLPDLPEDKN